MSFHPRTCSQKVRKWFRCKWVHQTVQSEGRWVHHPLHSENKLVNNNCTHRGCNYLGSKWVIHHCALFVCRVSAWIFCVPSEDKWWCTAIRFLWVSAKFITCTVVRVNGTLVEDKMLRFKGECEHFRFNKCPIYTHDVASAKFSTNSQEMDNSVWSQRVSEWIIIVL